ncbi:MAG TPA: FlgD immunoglobulin-like domain containing protein, partial [Candidatus Eisenbacteria bacterium]|nr:FlgD immunoglobulin-like domain containing protein [Candidatus Eisenbacteria bacterium]
GRVRATSNALSQELDIETAFVDPNAGGGTITNYPNPFHPGESPTTIAYVLDDNATVTMTVHTLGGGLVLQRTFSAGSLGGREGLNEISWDGKNGDGEYVASGGYILDVQAQGGGETLHHMRRKIGVVR